jgi:hypothetical protein
MAQVQINKWIRLGLSATMAIIAWAEGFNWTSVMDPKTALIVVGAIAFIKSAYNAMAPSAGVDTEATDGWIITQKAVRKLERPV